MSEEEESQEQKTASPDDGEKKEQDFEWVACRNDSCDSKKCKVTQLTDDMTRYSCTECTHSWEVKSPRSLDI